MAPQITQGKWTAYKDTLTQDSCVIDLPHKSHEKTYTEIGISFHQQDARFICECANQCQSVNPSNPLAVAQNIKAMYQALQGSITNRMACHEAEAAFIPEHIQKVYEVLSAIEKSKTGGS